MAKRPRSTVEGNLHVEYWPLEKVAAAEVNPKEHDLGFLQRSIDRFGFRGVVVLDERTGKLAAGHGRREALAQLKAEGEDPPEGIVERRGRWFVPVLRGGQSSSDEEASAFLIADNRSTELGGWNEPELLELLQGLGEHRATFAGFDPTDVAELERAHRDVTGRTKADEVPEPRATDVSVGDLYSLGTHRLLCGNATDSEAVGRLLGKARPQLTVTDPPYGVEYDPAWRADAAEKGQLAWAPTRTREVTQDDRVDWTPAWELAPGAVIYCWHAGVYSSAVQASLEAAGFRIRSQIIWSKSNFPVSRGHYHWRHEPCWYAVRKNKKAFWIGDRKQTTIWEATLDTNVAGGHSTQKPVELSRRALDNHQGDVYDPFAGTGSTLIAAEQVGRRCFAMELVPTVVQIIIDRWEAYTGKKARKLK